MRDKFNKLKYVISVLEKIIPANTTLRSCYEEFIIPFLVKVVNSQVRKYKNVKVRDIKPLSWYKYLHAYEKENNIIRPHVTLASATNVATNALSEPSNRNSSSSSTTTTTTTTTTTAVSGSNNRLNNFRIGLNAARAAMGDSPPQYNINTQQHL